MADYRTLLQEGAAELQPRDEARREAEMLLAHACGCPRETFYTWPEREASPEQAAHFEALIKQRREGCPVAYLTGTRSFWNLELKVNPAVLIPRADTELLVEKVLEQHDKRPLHLADLGTGSGAIALALASERPAWQIEGLDTSAEALACAEHNRQRLGLDNVRFSAGSWCDSLADKSCDVLVSNPPYIDPEDEHLAQGDLPFEPRAALVAQEQGLADIRSIAAQAIRPLKAGGALYLEHGYRQAKDVQAILQSAGYTNITTWRDLGKNERVTGGKKQETGNRKLETRD